MENQKTFESLLREFLTPIIENAVEKVFARNLALFQQFAQAEPMPDLWNIKMVAEYIHLSVPTIYGLVHKGEIPYYKKGMRLYFKKEDIDKWIGSGRRSSIAEIQENAHTFFVPGRQKEILKSPGNPGP